MPTMMPKPAKGFTLIEAVLVIVITGVLAAVVAVFIKKPIDAYFDSARRAELSDITDTAARRMARDINGALPNSVRQNGNFLEFVPIKAAGRYRADAGLAGTEDFLNFESGTDAAFEVLGPTVNIASGDSIVIYNQGYPGTSDVYDVSPLTNRRLASVFGTGLSVVNFTATGTPLPFKSPGSRFQIVSTPVTYECAANAADPANGFVYRHSNYPIQVSQPSTFAGATSAILAGDVASCSIAYAPAVLQRNGLVSIFLVLSKGGETVSLQHQVNVNNSP